MSSERVGAWWGNGLRSRVLVRAAADANDTRLVWVLANHSRRQNAHQLGGLAAPAGTVLGSTSFTEADLDDLAAREVAAWAGISVWAAGSWIAVADVLCTDLTGVLDAVAAGRLDLARAKVVAEAVTDLTPAQRRKVEGMLLETLPAEPLEVADRASRVGPWDARAPRSWAQTVNRAVLKVRVRTPEQVRDAARAATGTDLRVHRDDPSLATFTVTGPTEDLVCLHDAGTARVLAERMASGGAGTCLLLTDDHGHLTRVLRIGPAPRNGWARDTLVEAGRSALRRSPRPAHATDTYRPTTQIQDLVRARDPVCTFPGCGVPAGRCDLDHGVPHPRGPTSVQNLSPRSRRCHRYKTTGLWHVRTITNQTGNVTGHRWTSPLGAHQDVQVPPLPGHGPGEAYAACGQLGHGSGRAA